MLWCEEHQSIEGILTNIKQVQSKVCSKGCIYVEGMHEHQG